jgi:hypothetical protein
MPQRYMALPPELYGQRFTVHGHSSGRSVPGSMDATPGLSFHRSRSDKTTLFNVFSPVLFANVTLEFDQASAQKAWRLAQSPDGKKWQNVLWPQPKSCSPEKPCLPGQRCGPTGKCQSYRRIKAPMGYITGNVYPDTGPLAQGAISVGMFPGEWRNGQWIPGKFYDTRCPDPDKSRCPAITTARLLRFVPNRVNSGEPHPFSTEMLAGLHSSYRRRGQ